MFLLQLASTHRIHLVPDLRLSRRSRDAL